jgi:hypothetical protein
MKFFKIPQEFSKEETTTSLLQKVLGQGIDAGAKSTLYALTEASIGGKGWAYFGPLYSRGPLA